MPSFTDSTSTGAGSTWSPCNNCRTTPSAFLHKQLDVTAACGFAPQPHFKRIMASGFHLQRRNTC